MAGIGPVARDLGLVEQTLRNWVKAAKHGKLNPRAARRSRRSRWSSRDARGECALRMENEI